MVSKRSGGSMKHRLPSCIDVFCIVHPCPGPKGARHQPWGAGGGALNAVEREAMYKGVERKCQQG